MSDVELWGLLLAMGGTLILLTLVIGFILYFLYAMGLYKIAAKMGVQYPWLAFVPILQLQTLGMIVGPFKLGSYDVKQPELVLPVASGVSILLAQIPILGFLATLAIFILCLIAHYHLFLQYKPENAVLYTVLGFVLPFTLPFFIFSLRNVAPDKVK